MKPMILILSGVLIAGLAKWAWGQFWSFRAQSPYDYQGQLPQIDIRRHLLGPMVAEGVIFDFTGRVQSRFTGEMEGIWSGDTGQLKEIFTFSSGMVQNREWSLTLGADGQITGTAADIVGMANGRQIGSAVMLEYRLKLPETAGGYVIDVTDWMYLTEQGSIMNRAEFRKFGLKVGEMLATFRPVK